MCLNYTYIRGVDVAVRGGLQAMGVLQGLPARVWDLVGCIAGRNLKAFKEVWLICHATVVLLLLCQSTMIQDSKD